MWSSKLYRNRNNLLGPYKAKPLSFISCQWPWSLNSQINSTHSLSPSKWCTVISFSPISSALYSWDTPSVLLTLLLFTIFSIFTPFTSSLLSVFFSLPYFSSTLPPNDSGHFMLISPLCLPSVLLFHVFWNASIWLGHTWPLQHFAVN